jgi:hypothetical protein
VTPARLRSMGDGHAARVDTLGLAAIALVALSAFLMIGPLFLDAFQCRSFIGPLSLGLGPKPVWVRPVTCAFGSSITLLDVGFVGLVVASAWAVHARRRRLAVLALALTIAGAAWLFVAIGGPDLVRRIVNHLSRMV